MGFERLAHLAIVLLGMCALSAPSFGQVYKWKDEKGRVHYGDKPPGGSAEVRTDHNTVGNYEKDQQSVSSEDLAWFEKTKSATKCKFHYLDSNGKLLAEAAKKECLENLYLKERNPSYVPKTEAQDRANDYLRRIQEHRREVGKNAITNAKLDEINRKLNSIKWDTGGYGRVGGVTYQRLGNTITGSDGTRCTSLGNTWQCN
jgi:hypothetical protein